MSYRPPGLRVKSTTSYAPQSNTGITALDSTTRVAFAAWLRASADLTGNPDIFAQANSTPVTSGWFIQLQAGTGFRLRTINGSTITTLFPPVPVARYVLTGIPFHVFVTLDSTTGACDWYINAIPVGRSPTTVVPWTAGGTRVTRIGNYSSPALAQTMADIRVWAEADAADVLLAPRAYARLAMEGRPAGESARYLWGSPTSALDESGHNRHLVWQGPTPAQVASPTTSPAALYDARNARRRIVYAPPPAGGGASATPGTGALTLTGYAPTVTTGAARFEARVADVASTIGGVGPDGYAWDTAAINSTFQVFVPSAAALAAKGWTGLPYRVEIALHGDGERGTDGTFQMMGSGSRGQQLGWGSAQNGSLATPDQNWPTIVIFPQRTATHTGGSGMTAGTAGQRISVQIARRALDVVAAAYAIDWNHVTLSGLSGGTLMGYSMAYAYPTLFSAFVATAGYVSQGYLNAIPGVNFATTAEAQAATAQALRNVPQWVFNSRADTSITPTVYEPSVAAFTSSAQARFRFYESTTYDHVTTWTKAFLDDGTGNWTPAVASGQLWGEVLAQNHPLGTGALALSGFAPTVSTSANVSAAPGTGALTLTGFAPTASASDHRIAATDTGALTLSGFAPTASVSNHQTVTPGTGLLVLTGFAPTASLSDQTVAAPGTGVLTLSGFAPSVTASDHRTVAAGLGTLTLTGFAPSVQAGDAREVLPGTGVLALTGFAPSVSVSDHRIVAPGMGALALSGFAPSVGTTAHRVATPGTGVLVLAGYAPTLLVPSSGTTALDGSVTVGPRLTASLSAGPRLTGQLTVSPA